MLYQARVLGHQNGQDLMTNPNSLEGALVVRRIIDESKSPIESVGPNVGTTAIEKRPDHTIRALRLDSPEAAQSRSAKNSSEHRFGLVVLAVSNRDTRGAMSLSDPP